MARLLVVDDEPDMRLALKLILEKAGHEVSQADDGVQVKNMVAADRPDLILMDVAMPGMTGLQALEMLGSNPRTRDIPVVMVTVKGRPQDLQQAKALGALDYINKPWDMGEVELRVGWAPNKAARQRSNGAATHPAR